jgi:hypothetical protein
MAAGAAGAMTAPIDGRPGIRDLGASFFRTRHSPDGRHSVVFLYVGEIRFGPGLYRYNSRRAGSACWTGRPEAWPSPSSSAGAFSRTR